MEILDIIKAVASNPSKKEKEAILKKNKDNQLFVEILQRTYSPLIRYGMKLDTLPDFVPSEAVEIELSEIPALMDKISNGEVSGNEAKSYIRDILEKSSDDTRKIVMGIIDKSQKMGCSASTINKAIGRGTIKESAYMGAVSFDPKKVEALFNKESALFSQHKLDGRFANMVIHNGSVSMESRQGLPSDLGDIFNSASSLENVLGSGALNGELLIRGYEEKRELGNGIINSLVSQAEKKVDGESIEKEVDKFLKRYNRHPDEFLSEIYYVVWDFVPLENYLTLSPNKTPYLERYELLEKAIKDSGIKNIQLVDSIIVKNEEEAKAHFLKLLAEGKEGTVLKSMTSGWKKGKPTYQIKYKIEMEFEVIITGGNVSKSASHKGKISSLNAVSSCGLLTTSPGGLSESDMDEFTENLDSLIGSIITVKCNGISKSRDKDTYALSHPAFMGIRTDKAEADSLENMLETVNNMMELN